MNEIYGDSKCPICGSPRKAPDYKCMMCSIKENDTGTFAVRLYHNTKRKKSHDLTRKEAENFLVAVKHLEKYLKKEYGIGRTRNSTR